MSKFPNMWDYLHMYGDIDGDEEPPTVSDPRTRGFNYGAGWGDSQKPPVYYEALHMAAALRHRAVSASAEAWHLDMLVRNVRLAETVAEKRAAVTSLEQGMTRYPRRVKAS